MTQLLMDQKGPNCGRFPTPLNQSRILDRTVLIPCDSSLDTTTTTPCTSCSGLQVVYETYACLTLVEDSEPGLWLLYVVRQCMESVGGYIRFSSGWGASLYASTDGLVWQVWLPHVSAMSLHSPQYSDSETSIGPSHPVLAFHTVWAWSICQACLKFCTSQHIESKPPTSRLALLASLRTVQNSSHNERNIFKPS